MKTHKLQFGFGLVEIMIAMLIGLFLMGGLIQMFITSKQTYKAQDTVGRLQENQRFAMDFLVHDMRGVNSWGCFRDRTLVEDLRGAAPTTAPAGVSGIDGTGTASISESDTITLNGTYALLDENGADVFLKTTPAGPKDDLVISGGSTINNNDLILIGDCSDASLFTVTDFVKGATGGNGSISRIVEFKKAYDSTARLYLFKTVKYSIQQGTRGTALLTDQPSLYKCTSDNGCDPAIGNKGDELIEGVEDMQILYGEDTDTDGSPNYYVTANQVANMDNVVSIQVSLLLRSLDASVPPVIYKFNGKNFPAICPISAQRCYMRRSVTSVITIRNRLY